MTATEGYFDFCVVGFAFDDYLVDPRRTAILLAKNVLEVRSSNGHVRPPTHRITKVPDPKRPGSVRTQGTDDAQ